MLRKIILSICLITVSILAQADAMNDFLRRLPTNPPAASQADNLGAFVQSLPEQSIVEQWVREVALFPLTDRQVSLIVREVYASAQFAELDPRLIMAVLRTESRFNARAVSREGAKGLMQVIPRYHKDKLAGRDVYEPRTNIQVGTQILSDCFKRNKASTLHALSCYSGGGGAKYAKLVHGFNTDITSYVKENARRPIVMASAGD
jgi:soluble lytic murein transglycosylase-like protein